MHFSAKVAVLLCFLGACTETPDLCAQAEDLVYECRGATVDFGTCDAEAEDAAEGVLAGGCAALDETKSDVWTQACQGFLSKVFPWCKPEVYECAS